MNKKDINNKNIIITEKKRIIRNNFLILLLALILSLVFIFYTNDFIIENSKSVHNKNISLQEKIDELKHNIAEKEKTIKDLENNYFDDWNAQNFEKIVILNDKKSSIQILLNLMDLIKKNKIKSVNFSDAP